MIFGNILSGLTKTKEALVGNLKKVLNLGPAFSAKDQEQALAQLEQALYRSDVGVNTTQYLVDRMRQNLKQYEQKVKNGEIKKEEINYNLKENLKHEIMTMMKQSYQQQRHKLDLTLNSNTKPTVLFVVGVNGVGKTTTIAKLCHMYKNPPYNRKILVAAADVTRAAAVNQLEAWCKVVGVPVVKPAQASATSLPDKKTSPAEKVVADAIQTALNLQKQGSPDAPDLIIVDTAGRLQNNIPLLTDLQQAQTVSSKMKKGAPDHTWMVLDSTTGQTAIEQAKAFHKYVRTNGIIITKLDGTAKGGVVLGISKELSIPVAYVGVGEKVTDLKPFDPEQFVNSILDTTEDEETGDGATTAASITSDKI